MKKLLIKLTSWFAIISLILSYAIQQGWIKKEDVLFWTSKAVEKTTDYIVDNKDNIKENITWVIDKTIDKTTEIMNDPNWFLEQFSSTNLSDEVDENWIIKGTIKSFKKAKSFLEKNVYIAWNISEQKTFYCGCDYSTTNKKVDHLSCGYLSPTSEKGLNKRAKTIEWEHVVPAERFGKTFEAWTKGHEDCKATKSKSKKTYTFKGRKCANKVEPLFNAMEADLFNLVPAIWEVNALRSNYDPVDKIDGEFTQKFGKCDIAIYSRLKQFVPSDKIKGDIARVYAYMAQAYPEHIQLTDEEKTRFLNRNKLDPVDKNECDAYVEKSLKMKKQIDFMEEACKNLEASNN